MSEFFSFAGSHPILTWSLAWGLWPVCWMIAHIASLPFNTYFRSHNRTLRAQNIKLHGWPKNQLMDADGDIVHPPKPTVGKQ